MNRKVLIKNVKIAFFLVALMPLARLFWLGFTDDMGANPVEFVIHSLGTWGLVALLVTLSMSPIRMLTGASWPLQLRRMAGLYAFFYIGLHLLAYAGLDQWFDLRAIGKDIAEHPYILVGFTAFVLMVPLAVTSNNRMIRLLKQRWQLLHQLVYPIAILGVVHYWWLVKKDIREPLIYALVLMVLFGIRIYYRSDSFKSWLTRAIRTFSVAGK